MANELAAGVPTDYRIEILGISYGSAGFDPLMTQGNDLPWLQDPTGGDVTADWGARWRDFVILDPANGQGRGRPMPNDVIQAAFYRGNKSFAVEPTPAQEPGPGEVAIRIAFCGICAMPASWALHVAPQREYWAGARRAPCRWRLSCSFFA